MYAKFFGLWLQTIFLLLTAFSNEVLAFDEFPTFGSFITLEGQDKSCKGTEENPLCVIKAKDGRTWLLLGPLGPEIPSYAKVELYGKASLGLFYNLPAILVTDYRFFFHDGTAPTEVGIATVEGGFLVLTTNDKRRYRILDNNTPASKERLIYLKRNFNGCKVWVTGQRTAQGIIFKQANSLTCHPVLEKPFVDRPVRDLIECEAEFPDERWYCKLRKEPLNATLILQKTFRYGKMSVPILDAFVSQQSSSLYPLTPQIKMTINRQGEGVWPKDAPKDFQLFLQGNYKSLIDWGRHEFFFDIETSAGHPLWTIEESGDVFLIKTEVRIIEFGSPLEKTVVKLPAQCSLTLEDLQITLFDGDKQKIKRELDALRKDVERLQIIKDTAKLLHAYLLFQAHGKGNGGMCGLLKIAESIRSSIETSINPPEVFDPSNYKIVTFDDIEANYPHQFTIIQDAIKEAINAGAFPDGSTVDETWHYLLMNKNSINSECKHLDDKLIPSPQYFESFGNTIKSLGINNAQLYLSTKEEQHALQRAAWAIIIATKLNWQKLYSDQQRMWLMEFKD